MWLKELRWYQLACQRYSHTISPISFLSEVEGGGDSGDSRSGGDGSMSAAAGAITGAVCGLYGMYVVVGCASVLIIYWLPSLTTGKYALHLYNYMLQ